MKEEFDMQKKYPINLLIKPCKVNLILFVFNAKPKILKKVLTCLY